MKKRLVAIIVSLITVLTAVGSFGGITAYAETEEEYPFEDYAIMNLTTPEGFSETDNPTGTDENTPILFMEELELLKFVQYDCDGGNAKSEVSVYDEISDKEGSVTGGLTALKSTNLSSSSNALFGLNFVQSVSFDPTNSGRKDHVAFVGVDEDKYVQLVIYNAKDNKWSGRYQIGEMKSWVTNDTDNYAMEPHLSITAGDYDGNHVDTVVVFAAIDGTSCNYLWEFVVASDKQGVYVNESKSISGRMISPKYISAELDKKKLSSHTDKNGKNRLCGQVATGDFDNDGKDDLAVMTWLNRGSVSGKEKLDYELYTPYLCIAMGDTEDEYVINNVYDDQYIYKYTRSDGDKAYGNSINGPGMTVGSFSAGANDSLIIGGRSMTIQNGVKSGKCKDYNISENYNTFAVVNLNSDGSMNMALYVGEFYKDKSNNLTKHTAKRNNETYPSSTLCAVAFDGPGTAEYLFMDGKIYTMDLGYPVEHSDFSESGKWGDFGDISYISSVAVGNIDGNGNGYEKIVFTLMEKNASSQDDYHAKTIQIYASSRDDSSGTATAFACTKNPDKDVDDKGDNLNQGVNGIVVAVDCDNDGILAKFLTAECTYTDPEILAILQAAPYFSELYCNDFANLQNDGTTSLKISESHGVAHGEENSWDISAGLSYSKIGNKNILSLQADFNTNITKGWEDSIAYEVSECFEAGPTDQVIVYRTPVYIYTYMVYDETQKEYVNDAKTNMVFYVKQKPTYVQMSIDDYNDFARYYNDTMKNTNDELSKAGKTTYVYDELAIIENLASLGSEGDPSAYNVTGKILGIDGKTSQSKSLGTAGGQSGSELNITSEYTEYSSNAYGFTIAGDSTWKVKGNEKRSHWLGVNGKVESNWRYTDKTTTGYSVTAAAYVGNLLSSAFEKKGYDSDTCNAYGFTWDACIFSTEINGKEIKLATGEYYEDTIYKVPIIGYVVYENSVRRLPQPPAVENCVCKYNETGNYYAMNLEWKPAGYTAGLAGYDILMYKNGQYEKITRVGADATSYEYRITEEGENNYVFVVQPVTNTGVKGLRSDMMYGYSDVTGATIIKAEYKGIYDEIPGKTYYMYTLTQNDGTQLENFWLLSAGYMHGVDTDAYEELNNMGKTGNMSEEQWLDAIERIHDLNGHLVTNEFSIKRDIGICLETKWTSCSLCGDLVLCSTTTLNAHEKIETHVGNICTGQGYTEYYCDNCKISVGKDFEDGSHVYKTVTVAPTCCSKGYDIHYCIVCGEHYVDNPTEKDSNAHEYVTTEYCVCENGVHHKYSKSVCKYCGKTQIDDLGVEAGDDIQYQIETYFKISDGIYNPYTFCIQCPDDITSSDIIRKTDILEGDLLSFESTQVDSLNTWVDENEITWYKVNFTACEDVGGTGYSGEATFRIDRENDQSPMEITDVTGTIERSGQIINITAEFLKVLFAETYDDADSSMHIYETGCYTNSSLTSQYKRCVLCGRLETTEHVHDYTTCVINELEAGAETLENAKTTTVKTCWCGHCETVDGGEHEHTWVEGSQATCTYAGKSTRFCTTCGAFEVIEDSESVTDASVHHWVTKVVEPTCTEEGYTLHYCDFCNDDSIAYKTDIVSATGHVAAEGCDEVVDLTCTTYGYTLHKCSVCGETYMDPWILPAKGHNYVDKNAVVVAPTCSSKGYTVNYCTNCGSEAEYTNWTDIDEDNHTYIADVHNMTCVEKGYTVYTCQGCGDSYSLFFEDDENMTDEDGNRITEKDNTPSGHVQDESFTPVHHDATSTEDGYTEYLCKTCGEKYKVYDEKSDDDATEVTIIIGSGKPSDSDGNVGDYYKDKKTGDIYRKFANGWTLIGNVKDLTLNNSMKEAVNIVKSDVKINFGENSNISEADKKYINEHTKFDIKGVKDAVFDAAITNLLIKMFTDIGINITESDVNLFFANPNNTVDMWFITNVEVKDAKINGCTEPYIEFSFTVEAYARTTNASTGQRRAAMYTVKSEDYAAGSKIDVTMPVYGKLTVKEILHTSEDGKTIYDVYTVDGDKKFTYNKSDGTVTVPVEHFSNIKIKYDAGANGENVVTGDTNNIWLYVIIVLVAAAALGFAVMRLRKTRNN